MQRFQQPSKNYPPDTRIYNIPPAATRKFTGMRSTLTRENWPEGNPLVIISMEYSLDGLEWNLLLRSEVSGGVLFHRDGTVRLTQEESVSWFTTDENGNLVSVVRDGEVRVVIENRQTFRTALTLDMLEGGEPTSA